MIVGSKTKDAAVVSDTDSVSDPYTSTSINDDNLIHDNNFDFEKES